MAMEGEAGLTSAPCTCYVGNLAWSVTDADLLEYFSAAGQVLSAVVQTHADTGRSKGWALVKLATSAQAQFAIQMANGQEFHDRQLIMRIDRADLDNSTGTLVFVGNLPWSTTDSDLATLFASHSPMDVHVKTTVSGKSRGFALLRFSDPSNAAAAVSALHGTEFNGRTLEVREDRPRETRSAANAQKQQKQQPKGRGAPGSKAGGEASGAAAGGPGQGTSDRKGRSEPAPTNTLFVNNLNWNSTDDDLFQHFCTAGVTAKSAKVQMSETNGRSKGWGLVQYSSVEDAERARNQLNKTILDERKISVRFDAKAN